ncbi:hypothetical protein G6L37_04705 [Agrobacterium rubi]|nr:hypothetical protein [Agrobacterium rubi]NTF24654.1 hypothetical protein [Agrobacterium rubi]
MHSFAKLAKDRNWPGAEEFSGVTAFAAQLVLENLPQEGTLLPDNYGKPVLRGRPRYQPDLDWVLSDPEAAALRYLDPMIPESDTRIRPSSDFAVVASQCIDNKKITSDRPPFAVQMEALSKSVVRDLLCEIPLVERSKLNRFSQLMASNTSAIISAHEKDVLLIENLDISNKESIASAVNAMARVEQRCPFEFSRLGAVFAEHYILFATAENPSDPAEIPMKPLDIEELESLLPEVPEQRKSVPLRDYVKQLQQDMKANAYADLNFPLVRGGDRARYLIPLSHDAAYKRKARDLKERTEYRPSGFNATEFRKGKSGDNRTHFKRFSVDHWIGKRVSAFEKLRLSLLRDIQKMLDEPQFITDKRFHDTPAMMEQMRETSTEDYLHFANAFLHAIEQIPVMILEKVMPHGEVGLVIDGSSERAKEALEREMELSRRLSLSR